MATGTCEYNNKIYFFTPARLIERGGMAWTFHSTLLRDEGFIVLVKTV